MLVLTRKVGEEIVLPGCDVRFRIMEMSGKKCRVAITAPEHVVVHRGEVWLRIAAEHAASITAKKDSAA